MTGLNNYGTILQIYKTLLSQYGIYIGQIGWHIERGAAEFNVSGHSTNIFHTGRKQCPLKLLSYPAPLPFLKDVPDRKILDTDFFKVQYIIF